MTRRHHRSLRLQHINRRAPYSHERPWLFFLELCSLTLYLPIGALICRRRRNLGLIAESIQNNLSHLLHASFCCSSTAQPVQLFHSQSLQCSTYLKVVLPCSYCSLLLILECSVFFFFPLTTRITPGSAVLWLPPISASPSPHYVV